jgi:hypothetical protein
VNTDQQKGDLVGFAIDVQDLSSGTQPVHSGFRDTDGAGKRGGGEAETLGRPGDGFADDGRLVGRKGWRMACLQEDRPVPSISPARGPEGGGAGRRPRRDLAGASACRCALPRAPAQLLTLHAAP